MNNSNRSADRVLVTGASGFVGRQMIAALARAGLETGAAGREERPAWLPGNIQWFRTDLADAATLSDLPKRWSGVVHLAAESVPAGFHSTEPMLANIAMTTHLLDHLDAARVLVVSSCLVYGASRTPLAETSPVRPRGLYGLSKHLAEQTALAMLDKHDVRIARPFNHVGPGMREELAIPSLIRRIQEAAGPHDPVRMLGKNSVRDFVDVRDIVDAYVTILSMNTPTERIFNVCSGVPHTMEQVARTALSVLGQERQILFADVPSSADDADHVVGDPGRIQSLTSWRPRYTLADSLRAIIGR
jgi:GDP-4-dehydro-6-deoxy-D-mannose reductase